MHLIVFLDHLISRDPNLLTAKPIYNLKKDLLLQLETKICENTLYTKTIGIVEPSIFIKGAFLADMTAKGGG